MWQYRYDDVLIHKNGHKYIKREWKDGKWNYYYESGSGKRSNLGLINKIVDLTGSNAKENSKRLSAKVRYQKSLLDIATADTEYKRNTFNKSIREEDDALNRRNSAVSKYRDDKQKLNSATSNVRKNIDTRVKQTTPSIEGMKNYANEYLNRTGNKQVSGINLNSAANNLMNNNIKTASDRVNSTSIKDRLKDAKTGISENQRHKNEMKELEEAVKYSKQAADKAISEHSKALDKTDKDKEAYNKSLQKQYRYEDELKKDEHKLLSEQEAYNKSLVGKIDKGKAVVTSLLKGIINAGNKFEDVINEADKVIDKGQTIVENIITENIIKENELKETIIIEKNDKGIEIKRK